MIGSANFLLATACFANATDTNLIHDGLFLGLGASYNSIHLTQNSWGKGVGNITTNTGSNSNGVAEGTGAPFENNSQSLAPEIQIGYVKHFANHQNYLYGFKFSYQYLNSNATNPNLYIPQVGTITSQTGVTSPLYGWVNVDAVEVTTTHQFNLLGFIGETLGNKYFYFGVGPTLTNLTSRNYYSIGYAQFEGATVNVTGLISYSTPSLWLLGGAAQLGMTYYISPTWFIDASYTYSISASTTVNHQQSYAYTSSLGSTIYNSSGMLFTKNTLRIKNQTIGITLNKMLDV